jgi:chromatin segregation and condensation protein Rec8/ScpA/Scc1 (kleisin family)
VRGVGIHRIDSSRRRVGSRVGFLMAAVVVEMERIDHDGARSIRTIVPHELERVEEEDEDQLVEQEERQEQPGEEEDEEEERRRQRVKLVRPRTPERTSLGMTHEDDEEPRRWSSPWPYSVIDQVFEWLTKLSSQLESAVELSSTCKLSTPPCNAPYMHLNRESH